MEFHHRLALAFHRPDVQQFLREMSSQELTGWMAFDRISPIGQHRDDLHTAMIVSTLINMLRSDGSPVKLADCLPKWGEPVDEQAGVNKLAAALAALAAHSGGKVK